MSKNQRCFEAIISLSALLILSPLLIFISVLIKLSSRGPIIFRQERIGYLGEPFMINKFRTMRVNAEGQMLSTSRDKRVTKIGKWLRATKLDELPQLYNVLNGTMNLVGPRPEVPRFVDAWPANDKKKILSVKPGITDPASIHFKDEATILSKIENVDKYYVQIIIPQKLRIYTNYVESRSFCGDLKIIYTTILSLLRRA